jgi:hypothetical protein
MFLNEKDAAQIGEAIRETVFPRLCGLLCRDGWRVREIDIFEQPELWDRYDVNGTVRAFNDPQRRIIFIDVPRAPYDLVLVHELLSALQMRNDTDNAYDRWLSEQVLKSLTADQISALRLQAKASQRRTRNR